MRLAMTHFGLRHNDRSDAVAAPQRIKGVIDLIERELGRDEFGHFDLALPR